MIKDSITIKLDWDDQERLGHVLLIAKKQLQKELKEKPSNEEFDTGLDIQLIDKLLEELT